MHPRLPQQGTKSSTKQLAPTDPILGPENLLKTCFAQKGLPSCLSGRHKPQSFCWHQNIALLQPWCKNLYKNQPKHGPKNGTAWRSHFWDRMHSLVKEQKEKHFHGPIFGTVWRYQKWDRKIAKSTAKADPSEQKYNCVYLSKKHIDLEQRRPAHAKPDFNWLSGPKNGTWKRMWYQLSPFTGSNVAIAMQHDPGNIQQDKSFSSWLAAATLSP